MINDKNKNQRGGDNSENYQAESIVINHGVTYSEAKDIALDVYKANFLELADAASQLSIQRAEKLTDGFLSELKEQCEEAIEQMSSPDMQMSLYEAQKHYARTGDEDCESLLIDLLVNKAVESHNSSSRDLKKIVIDEAISVIPKLTAQQINTLSLIFRVANTARKDIVNFDGFIDFINTSVMPFVDAFSDSRSDYLHMEFAGCGSVLEASNHYAIEKLYSGEYSALFSKGFSLDELNEVISGETLPDGFIIRNFHNINLYQCSPMNDKIFEEIANSMGVPESLIQPLRRLNNKHLMSQVEVLNLMKEKLPGFSEFIAKWNGQQLSKFLLSPVGMMIAISNIKFRTGDKLDLSIWLK